MSPWRGEEDSGSDSAIHSDLNKKTSSTSGSHGGVLTSIIKAIASSLLTFFLIFFLLITLTLSFCMYTRKEQASHGEEWCKLVMNEYQSNPEKFVGKYSQKKVGDFILLQPPKEYADSMANFFLDDFGNYRCRYIDGGGLFPTSREYDSVTGEWTLYD